MKKKLVMEIYGVYEQQIKLKISFLNQTKVKTSRARAVLINSTRLDLLFIRAFKTSIIGHNPKPHP